MITRTMPIPLLSQNPSWNSTLAVSLIITICMANSAWPLAVLLFSLSIILLPQKERKLFLTFALLASLRMLLQSSTSEHPIDTLVGRGIVCNSVRTQTGNRILVQDMGGQNTLLRSQDSSPLPGDSITYQASLDSLRPQTVPGSFDNARWLASQGAQAAGALQAFQVFHSQWCMQRMATQVREWLRHTCHNFMLKGTDGIMLALLVGDKSGLDPEINQDFRNTGLVHILTVSGFHIVFLSAFLMMMLTAIRIPRRVARWCAVLLLVLFVPITGSAPSVERAVLMFFLVQTASVFEREALSLHALGIACSCILLWDPSSLFDIGFQLSAAATAGILLGQRHRWTFLAKGPKPIQKFVWEPLWVTLCASLATLPLLVYHFQTFSPMGLAGNLIVVPLMELAMEAGMFLTIFAWCAPLAHGFGTSASLLIAGSTQLTAFTASLPYATIAVGPWPWWLCLLLLSSTLAMPAAIAKKPPALRLVLMGCAAWSLLSLWRCVLEFRQQPVLHAWFLDAGQGDATLLIFPNGKTILLDVGNGKGHGSFGSKVLVPFLRAQGISHLDAIAITHPDLDHYGGAASLIDAFTVKEIWMTGAARLCDKSDWLTLWKVIRQRQVPVFTMQAGEHILGIGEYSLTILNAPSDWAHDDWNATSLTLFLQCPAQQSVMLTGDLGAKEEEQLLQTVPRLSATVLKLGHHGSRHSSSPLWIKALRPRFAMISAGVKNRYGHPSPEITRHLDSLEIPWWNTAEQGSLHVRMSGANIFITHYWDGAEAPMLTYAYSQGHSSFRPPTP